MFRTFKLLSGKKIVDGKIICAGQVFESDAEVYLLRPDLYELVTEQTPQPLITTTEEEIGGKIEYEYKPDSFLETTNSTSEFSDWDEEDR